MIADLVVALVIVAYYHTWEVAAIALAVVALRRAPWFANALAYQFGLDDPEGMTLFVASALLPAWDGARPLMSRSEVEEADAPPIPVLVSVPGTSDTKADQPPDRDITKAAWLVAMAEAKDERGAYLFSANDIYKAFGGRRGPVMARIKEIRERTPPAQFRQEEGGTAPATYPVTKGSG